VIRSSHHLWGVGMGLTEQDYQRSADRLDCEVAAIKAVDEVEASGQGFLPSGEPKILFEAHIFDRLTNGRFRKSHPTLSSAKWDRKLYGPAGQHQHKRLAQAVALDRESALQSASYGRFQVMGFNWKLCGYRSLQHFINAMYRSEGDHLDAFVGYVKARGLADELQRKDWAGFALGYNGPGYKENRYDTKLAAAYRKHAP
jgi:hypothetical protein